MKAETGNLPVVPVDLPIRQHIQTQGVPNTQELQTPVPYKQLFLKNLVCLPVFDSLLCFCYASRLLIVSLWRMGQIKYLLLFIQLAVRLEYLFVSIFNIYCRTASFHFLDNY